MSTVKNPYRVYEKKINQPCNERDITEFYFFNSIMNLFVNRFKYTGLPESIEPFFIERVMFFMVWGHSSMTILLMLSRS